MLRWLTSARLLTNPHVWVQWPHVFFSGLATAGFFMLGISAYRLLRVRPTPVAVAAQSKGAAPKRRPRNQSSQAESESRKAETTFFARSFRVAAVAAIIGAVMVGLVGHSQAQHMVQDAADEDGRGRGVVGHREPGVHVALHHRRHEGNARTSSPSACRTC